MGGRNDGFGQQYMALIAVYAFSVFAKRTFCVAPFNRVPHFNAQGAGVLLDSATLFNFVGGPYYGAIANPTTPTKRTAEDEIARLAPDLSPYHNVAGRIREWYDAAGLSLGAHSQPNASRADEYSVVLHIRRGDIASGGAVPKAHLLTSDAAIAECVATVMRQARRARGTRRTVLHVYSQGNDASEFDFLSKWQPTLHIEYQSPKGRAAAADTRMAPQTAEALTRSVTAMFEHMVAADSLIVAKSALSRVAGYLSRGRVYTPEREGPSMINGLQSCVKERG